jgi:hypothetical protein
MEQVTCTVLIVFSTEMEQLSPEELRTFLDLQHPYKEFKISNTRSVVIKVGKAWATACQHGEIRVDCSDCGGSNICEHLKKRNKCKKCEECPHRKRRCFCTECDGKHKTKCNKCKGKSGCESVVNKKRKTVAQ